MPVNVDKLENRDLFGYSFEKRKNDKNLLSPIPKNEDDTTTPIAGSSYGFVFTTDENFKSEHNLIIRYRELSLDPTVDTAIDDIVNEAISTDLDKIPVSINLSKLSIPDNLKNIIREEFDYITKLLNFEQKCHYQFKRWLIDGRLFYHKVVDTENEKNGIQELRYIDPLKIRKVKQRKKEITTKNGISMADYDEYYIYSDNGFLQEKRNNIYDPTSLNTKLIKFTKNSISFIPSGVIDYNKNIVLSYLHKAIKPANQLRMLEDSVIIYALTRASEKRIFYIDVGNLPKVKAEEYLNTVMNRYKNKMVYDSSTGEIKDRRHMITMLEDYWMPRRDSSKGTEITTLPAGQNLTELQDNISYFEKKLYRALNVPPSRQANDGGTFNIGRGSEISRDEIKFTKFVGRLRKQFSLLFLDLLKTQLLLKQYISEEEWETISQNIQIDYIYDNHYSEIKDNELFTDRLNLATMAEQFIGKYFSIKYIQSNILKQSDSDIEEIALQINSEKQLGMIPNEVDIVDQNQQKQ